MQLNGNKIQLQLNFRRKQKLQLNGTKSKVATQWEEKSNSCHLLKKIKLQKIQNLLLFNSKRNHNWASMRREIKAAVAQC